VTEDALTQEEQDRLLSDSIDAEVLRVRQQMAMLEDDTEAQAAAAVVLADPPDAAAEDSMYSEQELMGMF
jgi:hypothetical protein